MTPKPWPELRFAVAELEARRAMAAEAERAAADAERVRDLLRLRCTVGTSRWGAADRALLRRHRTLTASLKALRREARAGVSPRATTCPACAGMSH